MSCVIKVGLAICWPKETCQFLGLGSVHEMFRSVWECNMGWSVPAPPTYLAIAKGHTTRGSANPNIHHACTHSHSHVRHDANGLPTSCRVHCITSLLLLLAVTHVCHPQISLLNQLWPNLQDHQGHIWASSSPHHRNGSFSSSCFSCFLSCWQYPCVHYDLKFCLAHFYGGMASPLPWSSSLFSFRLVPWPSPLFL